MVGPDARREPAFATVIVEGIPWRVFSSRRMGGAMEVHVGERLDSRESILWAILRSTMWPMMIALPLLVAATWWAISGAVAPLRDLGQALARRQPQRREPVLVPGAPSEMEPMLLALNGLLARIEALMENDRRFTADAAHELRTPIAAIRARAEAALGARDPDERQHALKATLRGCDRAARLVAQLLAASDRGAGRAEDGSGLGWSIVQRIAALHQATLRVTGSAALGGTSVAVAFPLARIEPATG